MIQSTFATSVMMRNNGLLKWSLHKNKNGSNGKNWQHPPEALINGHIAYLVKFLGVTEAEHPKGIDVVKDCIRKLKLDEEIRRAEGLKTPKVEVTISVDGVAVQEPKGKKILHQFPLHQISYSADDKAEKKYFTFIAKEGESHKCFVFASDKLAEEITLTIGQAFDLAYRRFLESSGRELELKREIMVLQKRIAELENENSELKQKMMNPDTNSNASSSSSMSDNVDLLLSPPVPPRNSTNVANQLIAEFTMTANEIEKRAREDGVILFDPPELDSRAVNSSEAPPKICPPPLPKSKRPEHNGSHNNNNNGNGRSESGDIFGSDPFFTSADPFGMTNFTSAQPASEAINGGVINGVNGVNGINGINGVNGVNGINGVNGTSLMNGDKSTSPFSNNQSPYSHINSDLFNTSTMNMNVLNQFSFQQQQAQQQQQSAAKPAAIDSALEILDKRIEEMKLGFSRGIFKDDFPSEQLKS